MEPVYSPNDEILSKEELKSQTITGEQARLFLELLEPVFVGFDKDCFERFKALDMVDYQKVDNRDVFLLQLEMKVVDKLKSELFNLLQVGKEAKEILKEE